MATVPMPSYDNSDLLISACGQFIGKPIDLFASIGGKQIRINDSNVAGSILETVVGEELIDKIVGFERGPPQASPDFRARETPYEFEQKVALGGKPGFDIANYASYIDQLVKPNGVNRKIFQTRYLVFDYIINAEGQIVIKDFHYLPVYKMISTNGPRPISLQVKRGVWYNIRPDSPKNWSSASRTPHTFIEAIIESIRQCPQIESKDEKINSITNQYHALREQYTF